MFTKPKAMVPFQMARGITAGSHVGCQLRRVGSEALAASRKGRRVRIATSPGAIRTDGVGGGCKQPR